MHNIGINYDESIRGSGAIVDSLGLVLMVPAMILCVLVGAIPMYICLKVHN